MTRPTAASGCPPRSATPRIFAASSPSARELYEKGNENIAAGLGLFDRERANIEAGQAWSAAHAETSDAAARLANDYPGVGAYVLGLRLHPRQWIGWMRPMTAGTWATS